MKGIERNAYGQDDLNGPYIRVKTHVGKQGSKGIREEIIIFEEAQEAEVDAYADEQPHFPEVGIFGFMNSESREII